MVKTKEMIAAKGIVLSNEKPFVLIAGPCQMESRDHAMMMAEKILNITSKIGISFIYKTSFDKANRTSITGKRGVGLAKSLPIFEEIKKTFNNLTAFFFWKMLQN